MKKKNITDNVHKEKIIFNNASVEIYSAKNKDKIYVLPYLKNPKEFYGDLHVDHVVRFKNTFKNLIGTFNDVKNEWERPKLAKQGIIVLEHHYMSAKKLMNEINKLAQKIITKPKLYDDIHFCKEYYFLAEQGYNMLRSKEKKFNMQKSLGYPVSLERAGLVTTRLALGLKKDALIRNEIKVVTKRTHLVKEQNTCLTVTVKWREKQDLKTKIKGQTIELCDFINPASGASTAAFILASIIHECKPQTINHRSISLTQQGALFMKKALNSLDIESTFYSVGECNQLNNFYYLTGKRAVADAGHVLRHFLPKWYHH